MIKYRVGDGDGGNAICFVIRRGDHIFPVSNSTWQSLPTDHATRSVMRNGIAFGGSPSLTGTVATMRAQFDKLGLTSLR
jgi:hypothetical protein